MDIDVENESKELHFIYDQLRKEIANNDILNWQILAATLILTTIIMGFGVTLEVKYPLIDVGIFWFAGAVAFVGLWQSNIRSLNTLVKASYLRVFVETRTQHIRWETRLGQFRHNNPTLRHRENIGYGIVPYGILILTNMLIGSWFMATDVESMAFLIRLGIIFIVWAASMVAIFRMMREIHNYIDGNALDAKWVEAEEKLKPSDKKSEN